MAAREEEAVVVDIGGRGVRLTNLGKVLYPGTGLTKAGVIDYYRRVAPAILAQLRDRPVTRIRFPDGAGAGSFCEKNVPGGAPTWLRSQTLRASELEPLLMQSGLPCRPEETGPPTTAAELQWAVAFSPFVRSRMNLSDLLFWMGREDLVVLP